MAFNPAEPRALDGKWIKGLGHLEAAKKIAALPLGKKATIKGNPVRNLEGKGYRVRINNVGVNYKHPEDAARSMVAGQHMPQYKRINELSSTPSSEMTYVKQQELKQLKSHPQFSQLELGYGGPNPSTVPKSGSVAPHVPPMGLSPQKQSQILKEAAAKENLKTSGVASEAEDTALYNKGLITAEEFFAAHNKVPPGSGFTAAQLNQDALAHAKAQLAEHQDLASAVSEAKAAKNDAPHITTLKSGKSVAFSLGGMDKAKAQSAFNVGQLTTTEFFARFGELPAGAHTSIPNLDLKTVNGLRKELGLPVFTQKNMNDLAAKATAKSASKVATTAGEDIPKFDPKVAPSSAPAGSLVGTDAWDKLPMFNPSSGSIKMAIKNYTGSGYVTINTSLRKGLVKKDTAGFVKGLDDAFKEVKPTTKDMVLYRGVHSDDSMFGSTGSHIGGVFIDGGFVSTSSNSSTAGSFGSGAFIQVIIPKGSKVLNTNGLSGHGSEREVILNRGSMFQIVEDRMAQFGDMSGVHLRIITLKLVS